MMKRNLSWLAVIPLLFAVGCGTLNSTGPYKGDKTLYDADIVLITSYDVVHEFVSFEYKNREALASVPAIKASADAMRDKAPAAFTSAYQVRDTYAASSTSANATALSVAIDVVRAMAVEATRQLTTIKIVPTGK